MVLSQPLRVKTSLTVCLVLVLVEVQMPNQYQYRIELQGTVGYSTVRYRQVVMLVAVIIQTVQFP